MSSKAGDGFLAGRLLVLPVPDGEGLPRDSGSLTKSEVRGLLSTSFPSLQSVQNRWVTTEPETWLCVPALPLQAV